MLSRFRNPSLLLLKCGNGQWKKRTCRRRALTRGAHLLRIYAAYTQQRYSFLLNTMSFPEMIRNVAVVGHLHHGKTALMDMLVFETHKLAWDADKPVCELSFLNCNSLCCGHPDKIYGYSCSVARTRNLYQVFADVSHPVHDQRQITPGAPY